MKPAFRSLLLQDFHILLHQNPIIDFYVDSMMLAEIVIFGKCKANPCNLPTPDILPPSTEAINATLLQPGSYVS